MRFYLALTVSASERGATVPGYVIEAARQLATMVLPVPAASLRHGTWFSPDRHVALLSWTNEPRHDWLPDPLVNVTLDGQTGVLGITGHLNDPTGIDRLRTTSDLGTTLDHTGGAFGVFRALPSGIDAVTSITRTDPVYHCESNGLHLVSNRASLGHLVARAADEGPDGHLPPRPAYDIAPMQALVRHGFYLTDDTPFEGLTTLPELSTLRVRDGRAVILRRDPPQAAPTPARLSPLRSRRISELADTLVASVEPLRTHPDGVSVALSGGRDSRLIAATLYAAGIPFRATTTGVDDHPDVELAREICSRLGVAEHQVKAPDHGDSDSTLTEHLLPRTLRLVRMTEGMNSAFDSAISPESFELTARLSGSGSEVLRGGWLRDQPKLTKSALLGRLRTITQAQSPMMTHEANAAAHALFDEFSAAYAHDLVRALDELHLKFRTGRWLPGSRTATLSGSRVHHPFLDHRLQWQAMRVSPEWRWSEEVMYRLIERLAPPIARMPIANHPWRFDDRRGHTPLHRRARRSRPVRRATSAADAFHWHRPLGPNHVAAMRERILDTPELFRLADRRATERILDQAPTTPRTNQVWSLYTIAVLLSDEWLSPKSQTVDMERVRGPVL
ncbi:asparagine synthase-related protein [Halostreptopolyspora alba]|uniref:Asparagine synthetase domain-containing protein n=1 Tax=Halostreptopolyspora alba TaxID=2487137 RepID=A0A3N0E6M1_9ACTN|nr:hypothetical protein EFW17_15775 [Nocardiopsaceae bacterium YIM 96095]